MQQAYVTQDLIDAYRQLGIRTGDCIYVTGNLGMLGIGPTTDKEKLLSLHYQAIRDVIGESGTLVVPTHSFSICNTDQVFDPNTTPSETGPFTQYVMDLEGSVRQFHPFSSRTAIGPLAQKICGDCSRNSYGYFTPFQHMLELDAKFISLGMHPRFLVSLVHQCEQDMAVPYRYNKEFMHPVLRGDSIEVEPFYHPVTYRDCDISRNKNQLFFEQFDKQGLLGNIRVGTGNIYAFNMKKFYLSTNQILKENIYSWLNQPPASRPYQK